VPATAAGSGSPSGPGPPSRGKRADLLGAEGDHCVDGPGVDGIQPPGSVAGDVDADLLEDLDRLRTDGEGDDPAEETSVPGGARERAIPRPSDCGPSSRRKGTGCGAGASRAGPPPRSSTHRFADSSFSRFAPPAGRVIFRSQIAMGRSFSPGPPVPGPWRSRDRRSANPGGSAASGLHTGVGPRSRE